MSDATTDSRNSTQASRCKLQMLASTHWFELPKISGWSTSERTWHEGNNNRRFGACATASRGGESFSEIKKWLQRGGVVAGRILQYTQNRARGIWLQKMTATSSRQSRGCFVYSATMTAIPSPRPIALATRNGSSDKVEAPETFWPCCTRLADGRLVWIVPDAV